MVGVGIAGLAFSVLAALVLFTSRSFAALGNYVDLGEKGTHAMDILSKEIRQASRLTAFATNLITLDMGTNLPVTYTYSTSQRALSRSQGTLTSTVLTNCDSLQFSIYQRTPLAGTYDQYPVAVVTNCKVVTVQWNCSRKIFGQKMTTESDQEAKIVIRKF
jgi:hypothetical protein